MEGKHRGEKLRCAGHCRCQRLGRAKGVELVWQDDLGLYDGEIDDEGVRKQVWMEEERSLGLKMDLIRENDLAGVACWKLGFEPASVWDVIKVNE